MELWPDPDPDSSEKKAETIMNICPRLGDLEDPELRYFYPTLENQCHQAVPVEPVSLVFQSAMCLSENHRRCPLFRGTLSGPLPEKMRGYVEPTGLRKFWKLLLAAGAVLLVLLAFGLNFVFPALADALLPPPPVQAASATEVELVLPGATGGATPLLTASPTATPTSRPTRTPTEITPAEAGGTLASASLADITANDGPAAPGNPGATSSPTSPPNPTPTPCGPPAGWLSYTVRPGDTLFHLAQVTGTTVERLKSANCLTSTKILVGQRLVLPGLPPNPTRTSLPTATMPEARSTESLATRSP